MKFKIFFLLLLLLLVNLCLSAQGIFEYGKPRLSAKEIRQNAATDSIVVSVDVKNVGKREGK